MNAHGRLTAAVGSVALNVVLALIMAQQAGAATPVADKSEPEWPRYVISVGDDHHPAQARCVTGMRSRAMLAVLLALIV
jgi:hypothetical protein